MRLIKTSQLQEGMILAKSIIYKGNILVNSNKFLTQDCVNLIKMYKKQVYVYDLDDAYEALYSVKLTEDYLGHILNSAQNLFSIALSDEKSFNSALSYINKFLSNNRDTLHQLLVLQDKHPYTFNHSLNVATYSIIIGLSLGLSTSELVDLLIGGMLHDIGKLKISNSILDKPNSLSTKEYKAIQRHPIYGLELLSCHSSLTDNMKMIAYQHHEKLDGTGYPNGIKGNQISYLSRIITVSDIFDAVISKRVYHKTRTAYTGAKIIYNDANSGRLDKTVTNALIGQIYLFKMGNLVELSNGLSAYVLQDCKGIDPIVKTITGEILDLSRSNNISIISA